MTPRQVWTVVVLCVLVELVLAWRGLQGGGVIASIALGALSIRVARQARDRAGEVQSERTYVNRLLSSWPPDVAPPPRIEYRDKEGP